MSTLDNAVNSLEYRTLAAPGRTAAGSVFDRILQARTVDELVRYGRSTSINLAPTWDANPFFFNQLRLTDPASMVRALRSAGIAVRGNLTATLTLLTLVIVSMIAVLLVLLAPARGSVHHVTARALFWSSAYFLLIGIAFMFVEISLILRMSLFLGHPIYGLAIVLFGLILATGLGSLLSARAVRLSRRSLVAMVRPPRQNTWSASSRAESRGRGAGPLRPAGGYREAMVETAIGGQIPTNRWLADGRLGCV